MTENLPEWYMSGKYPELRSGPPWIMEEMVEEQSTIPGLVSDVLVQAASELADALRTSAANGEPIVVCAVGTSGHAARFVTLVLNDALAGSPTLFGPVEARESADQALTPRAGGVCLVVSHGGLSTSTVNALSAAKAEGAVTALITAAADSPAKDLADHVLRTPLVDRSFCHTIGYTSPIIAALLLSSLIQNKHFAAEKLTTYLRSLHELRSAGMTVGARLGQVSRLIAAGSLVDTPTARELALKVAEGARIPTSALGVEDVLHGHMVAHDSDSALVVVVTAGTRGIEAIETAGSLLTSARRIGIQTAAIVSDDLSAAISEEQANAGTIVVPTAGVDRLTASGLGGALALQYLTVGLVRACGTNPDLIRREEEAYREAVAVGGAKHPRR